MDVRLICSVNRPFELHLVHFKSRDLARNLKHGRFWHVFFPTGGFVIDQDDDCTFTAHYPMARLPDAKIDPHEIVYHALGGVRDKHSVKIDEILVDSTWSLTFSIAERYVTPSHKVMLAGDAGKYSRNLYHLKSLNYTLLIYMISNCSSLYPASWWLWHEQWSDRRSKSGMEDFSTGKGLWRESIARIIPYGKKNYDDSCPQEITLSFLGTR